MKNFRVFNASSKLPGWLRGQTAVWHWLIEPSPSVIEPERRLQARLLMAMLLTLIIVGLLSLTLSLLGVYSKPGEPKTVGSGFRWITLAAVLLFTIEYGLSRTVHYPLAAALAVCSVLSPTFVIVILNPENLQYIFYLVLGGLLGSLFLSARTTAIVFLVTLIGLLLLPAFAAGFSASNN